MAAEQRTGFKRKRDDHKISEGQRVEVRNMEEGRLGSWHTATVILRKRSICNVQYDHLVCDNEKDPLKEGIRISSKIDGVKPSKEELDNYRGFIRPLPPQIDIGERSLRYGECVDSFFDNAWWEGVIFDHEDGLGNRKVFFPDMGNEKTECVKNLRITQDWDEVTEEWKPRGNWVFLELVEEVERKIPFLISVKQIWFEVCEKNEGKDQKEWTFSGRDYWRELVRLVLLDNLKHTGTQFLRLLNSKEGFIKERRISEFPEPEEFVDKSLSLIPYSGDFAPNMDEVGNNSKNLDNVIIRYLDEVLSSTPSIPLSLPTIRFKNSEVSGENLRSSKRRSKLNWSPIVLEPQCFPEAIAELNRASKTCQRTDLYLKVRKHLLYEGWKVESVDDHGMIRFRYISPSGTKFMSISTLCKELELMSKTVSVGPVHSQRSGGGGSTARSSIVKPQKVKELSKPTTSGTSFMSVAKICELEPMSKTVSVGPVISQRSGGGSTSRSSIVKPHKVRELSMSKSTSGEPIIDPEFCPQAVIDYVQGLAPNRLSKKNRARNAILAAKAKKHLVFCDWSIYKQSKGYKKELRYRSPAGIVFYSLLTACKSYLKENSSFSPSERQIRHADLEGGGHMLNEQLLIDSAEKLPALIASDVPLSNEHAQPSKSRKKRKQKAFIASDSHSSTRVLRSSKRARTLPPSSSHQTPRSILSWLIDNNVVLPRAKVYYRGREDGHKKEGRITRDGIKCNCCQKVYGLSNFGAHAGSTTHCSSANIVLEEDGRSIFDCQWVMKKKLSARKAEPRNINKGRHNMSKNDDICSICHDGGELILCDQCPSSFHPGCVGLKELPAGDWFCPLCRCGICDKSKFDKNKNQFTDNNALNCCQCEHKYHVACLRNKGLLKHHGYPEGYWFCNEICEQIFEGLNKLLGKPIQLGTDDLTWTLVKYTTPDSSCRDDEHALENYSKLNVAIGVMHECFEPVKESRTGRDLMEDIIFSRGSELNRLNFQGFYAVLLERNDELITVATLRVHGEKVAEIPLVATRFQYRRLGMCRILMNVLEKKLGELGVERLVLPAATSVLDAWINKFGFAVMEESLRLSLLDFNILNFHGTVMCQKLLARTPSMELIVLEEPKQHIFGAANTGNAELDGTSAVSEVLQAEQIDGSDIIDEGTANTHGGTDTNDHPGPLALVAHTAPDFLAQNALDCSADRREVGNNDDAVGVFKCYQRRRFPHPEEPNLLNTKVVTDG